MEHNKTVEKWEPIEGYDGMYQVSNMGRILSMKKGTPYILKPYPTRQGYMMVRLYENGGKRNYRDYAVHRLVAIAFIPNNDGKPEVNHIDGNKANNCADNLEWCTPKENMAHSWEKGLSNNTYKAIQQHSKDVQTPVIVTNVQTGESYKFASQKEACKALGLDTRNLNMVLKGKRRSHGGYTAVYDAVP